MPEDFVPSFKVSFSETEIAETLTAIESVLRSGRLILGPNTAALEEQMAGVAGVAHGIAVSTGSTALEIAFKSLEVADKRVLVPTNTNFATAAAAHYAGARVELYDGGLYPSIDDIEARLANGGDVAALVIVHIGGYITPDIDRIVALCEANGIALIEDCAHAHGALYANKPAGSFGRAAAFSFFPTKTITTGEGGLLATNDAQIAELARQYRDQGKNKDGVTHEVWGNSWRITEMGAALGLAQLQNFERDALRRSQIIRRYQTELRDTVLKFPEVTETMQPGGYKAIAYLPAQLNRDDIKRQFLDAHVELGRGVYEKPLHMQPVFDSVIKSGAYAEADDFAANHVCLPLWRSMTDEQVSLVITAAKRILA